MELVLPGHQTSQEQLSRMLLLWYLLFSCSLIQPIFMFSLRWMSRNHIYVQDVDCSLWISENSFTSTLSKIDHFVSPVVPLAKGQ